MTHLEPNNAKEWYEQGCRQLEAHDYEAAVISFDKALAFDNSDSQTWTKRSEALWRLDGNNEAVENAKKAIQGNSDNYGAWIQRGHALNELGEYEKAIDAYDQAIKIGSDIKYKDSSVWYNRGRVLANDSLGLYESAIVSCNQALKIEPDSIFALHGRGCAFLGLGENDAAKADYERSLELYNNALNIKPDDYILLYDRGLVRAILRDYEGAKNDYIKATKLKPYFWSAWNQLAWLLFNQFQKFREAINLFTEGLGSLQANNPNHHRGLGELYYSMAHAYYEISKKPTRRLDDWVRAIESFNTARRFLTPQFPERSLEVLQDLIKVCREHKEETNKVKGLLNQATEELNALLVSDFLPTHKIRIARKFASFKQSSVDDFIQSVKAVEALNLAENQKNTTLHWFWRGWKNTDSDSPKYPEIREFLPSRTAAIYWHISSNAMTTFILKNSENRPLILGIDQPSDIKRLIPGWKPDFPRYEIFQRQFTAFDEWMKKWKQDYQTYHNSENQTNCDWYKKMKERLGKLADILKVSEIEEYLADIGQLILIPHRDLHLLPLHYLFLNYITTYLPSFRIGIEAQKISLSPGNTLQTTSLVIVEDPETSKPIPQANFCSKLLFSEIESAAISSFYHYPKRIKSRQATKLALENALLYFPGILHFSGHGYHDLNQPLKSALALAGEHWLTLEDIFNPNFSSPYLVCLSACETGITSKQDLIDEYVGLVSGFLKAKAAYVLSTLWTVDEVSTAIIMIHFYQLLKAGETPAIALRKAQQWLGKVTYADLKEWYQDLSDQIISYDLGCYENFRGLASIAQKESAKMGLDYRPYSHPYYWAGFTITGKVTP